MSLNTNLFHDTVTIERHSASGVDDRGNLTSDWASNQADVKCRVISGGSTEDRDGKNTIIEGLTVFFDKSVNIKANDRIKNGTLYYEITGVQVRKDAKGETSHTVVDCLYRE